MIKLILVKLKEKLFINILLAIQVYIAVLAINMSIGQIQYYKYFNDEINKSSLKDAVYMYLKDNNTDEDELGKSIRNLPNFKQMCCIYNTSLEFEKVNSSVNVYMHDEFLLNFYKLRLEHGKFIDSNDTLTNPVIISSSLSKYFKVGEEVNAIVSQYNSRDGHSEHKVVLKVQGILKKPEYILQMNQGGDSILLSDIFGKDEEMIISGNLKTSEGVLINGTCSIGKILVMDDISKKHQTLLQWKEALQDTGWVNSMEEIEKEQEKVVKDKIIQQSAINLVLFLLIIVGVGGNSLVSTFREMKEYSLYYLCGASWKICILINAIITTIIVVIPSILSYSLLLVFNNLNPHSVMIINFYNFVFSFVLIMIVFFFSSFFVLINIFNNSPISALRRHG